MTGFVRCVAILGWLAATARAAPSAPPGAAPSAAPPGAAPSAAPPSAAPPGAAPSAAPLSAAPRSPPSAVPAAPHSPAPPPPRILVLPLPPTTALDANVARTFDARLLVALDDSRRVVTVTPSDEPECTTTSCLAALGAAADAALVLSLSAVREDHGVTLFGTVVDTRTGTAVRRVELDRVTEIALAKQAPSALVPQIVGAPAGPPVLGVSSVAIGSAHTATLAMIDQLAALRAFKVLPLDGSDRSTLTHTAEVTLTELNIDRRRHLLCTWFEGTLVGTFAITELATGRVVFTRTVTATAERRAHFSSRAEITDLLIEQAVADWMAAFREARRAKQPSR